MVSLELYIDDNDLISRRAGRGSALLKPQFSNVIPPTKMNYKALGIKYSTLMPLVMGRRLGTIHLYIIAIKN